MSLNGCNPTQQLKKNLLIVSLFVITILIISVFQPLDYVYSITGDENTTSSSGGGGSFIDSNFIWGFIGALGVLIPVATGIAYSLKRSVNASTQEFIKKQSETFEKERKETRDQIQAHQNTVSNQIVTVNNNVNEKFLASKESIIDIKKTIEDIDEKLDESRTQNTENKIRLNEVDRRLYNLEQNRSSHNALGKMGVT